MLITGYLQNCPQRPDFGKQHHVEHFPQIAHAASAARTSLEADYALHSGDMAKTPKPEGVFEVGQFLGQLVQVKELLGVAVGHQPGLLYFNTFNIALRPIALQATGGDI